MTGNAANFDDGSAGTIGQNNSHLHHDPKTITQIIRMELFEAFGTIATL